MAEITTQKPSWLQAWYDAKRRAKIIEDKVEKGELPESAAVYARKLILATGGDYDNPPESLRDALQAEAIVQNDMASDSIEIIDSIMGDKANKKSDSYAFSVVELYEDAGMSEIEIENQLSNYAAALIAYGQSDPWADPPGKEPSSDSPLNVGRDANYSRSNFTPEQFASGDPDAGPDFRTYSQNELTDPQVEARLAAERADLASGMGAVGNGMLAPDYGRYAGELDAGFPRPEINLDRTPDDPYFAPYPNQMQPLLRQDPYAGVNAADMDIGEYGADMYGVGNQPLRQDPNYSRSNFTPEQFAQGNPDTTPYQPNPERQHNFAPQGQPSVLESVKGLFTSIGDDEYRVPDTLATIISNPLSFQGANRMGKGIQQLNEARGTPGRGKIARAASMAGPIVASLVPGSLPLGLFGGFLNSLGFHHDYKPGLDKNIVFDSNTGVVSWEGTMGSEGRGGYQEGWINAENMFKDMDPKTEVKDVRTGLWTTAEDIANFIGIQQGTIRDPYDDVPFGSQTGNFAEYVDGSYDTPFGYQDSEWGVPDNPVSNYEALHQLTNRVGNAWNALPDEGLGYNERVEASEIAAMKLRAQIDAANTVAPTPDQSGLWYGTLMDDSSWDSVTSYAGSEDSPDSIGWE